jgi:primosomal protein N' (replication factor Y)
MTWHEKENRLVCHHCNISRNFDPTCSKCGGVNLSFLGSGAEGITKHLKKLFPDRQKDILSFDKESLDTAKLMNLKNAIIVGTQAVWQHIQWQNLGLIAFIDADTPLFTPEYLSSENLWFSIRDASSKINADCRFILQTRSPDHPIYSSLSEPVVFYTSELDSRRIFDYPPYRFILKIFSSGSTDQEITANSANIYRGLQQLTKTFPDIKITQPLNLFPYFLKNRYRKAIILKLPYRNYKQLLKIITKLLPSSWKTDPNPINLLSI